MAFVWLVSYPKSGNTWLRVLLSNYRRIVLGPANLNEPLIGTQSHLSRHGFDEIMGIPSSELSEEELVHHRHKFHALFIEKYPGTSFTKVHETYDGQHDAPTVFPADDRCKVIYLVRNPLDIAPSFAHHENCSIEEIIRRMADERAMVRHGKTSFSEHIGAWDRHVLGWTEQDALPVLTIRYEDMLTDPRDAFSRIINFSELSLDRDKLEQAIESSRFDALQEKEKETGFSERPLASSHFFRKGRAGTWEDMLSDQQRDRILSDHGSTMQMFGYA
jgi:aryl sulfotransferase